MLGQQLRLQLWALRQVTALHNGAYGYKSINIQDTLFQALCSKHKCCGV